MRIETDLSADELLRRGELAQGFAGMMDGRTKEARDLKQRGHAMVMASIEKHFGWAEPLENMSDDELAEALRE